jgi:hypothetical protein
MSIPPNARVEFARKVARSRSGESQPDEGGSNGASPVILWRLIGSAPLFQNRIRAADSTDQRSLGHDMLILAGWQQHRTRRCNSILGSGVADKAVTPTDKQGRVAIVPRIKKRFAKYIIASPA